ncbi:TIGR03088 family PEP-CTERM/XrtA system glycosyltransferase [Motiliproteus sediminis]|uniref:TIGR03088 family PEP-CTERM/XrtA system glycosyltransferase n=1 Tax=Motiliproteus sediminis TaxID=1468178 RepID=UPI001AEFE3EE|nr:TIGR03088 family PEP-CTERM/XrtA system glycosyltransferase [Motiliproteus sediminis]
MTRISNQQDFSTALPDQETEGPVATVAHLVYRFDVGGLENGIVNIINNLPHHRYRHHIICLDDFNPDFFTRVHHPNTRIHALHKPPGKGLGYLYRLKRLLDALQPHIVHSRNLATLECQLAARWAGVAARIHGEHGWDSLTDSQRFKPALLRKVFSPLIHRYIALSNEGVDYLQQKIGIRSDRIERICNGVDTQRFLPAEQDLNVFSPQRPLLIGTVGRLASVKNHALLIRAFAKLRACRPDWQNRMRLVIVGDGPLKAQLQALIAQHELSQYCDMLGACDDIPRQMQRFDLYVQPSLAEGISNTILEALACGLAVVTTDVGGARELVEHNLCGQIIANDNIDELVTALCCYLDAPAQIAQHGSQARQRALREFSIEGMVARYHTLYQQLLRSNR